MRVRRPVAVRRRPPPLREAPAALGETRELVHVLGRGRPVGVVTARTLWRTVLVVDDEPIARKIVINYIEQTPLLKLASEQINALGQRSRAERCAECEEIRNSTRR